MKQALIAPEEKVYKYDGTLLGGRVAQTTTSPFEVAPSLFWLECADDVNADTWYYNIDTHEIEQVPEPPPPTFVNDEPKVI